jgi:hypothetical protein
MPAAPQHTPGTDAGQADLASLASELIARGYTADLRTPCGGLPCLRVANPGAPALTEKVYAQGGNYWYSWAEPIAACDEPAAAAATLARVLRTAGE